MSNLFSIFDPQSFLSLPLNWLSPIVILLCLPSIYWISFSQIIIVTKLLMKFVYGEFKAITGNHFTPGGLTLTISLFLFIALNNFLGLFPYIFTASSHLTFTVALALPLWLGHMLLAWQKTPQAMLAHLVPTGTPYVLMPFMVIIEMVSNVIRPLTLSVRLAANMVAGHLLLTLLSSLAPSLNFVLLILVLTALVLLATLESAVALIQAYVFSVLSTLYLNEVNSNQMNK